MSAADEDKSHPTPLSRRVLAINGDDSGGAARAALRISTGLRSRGLDLEMAVQRKTSDKNWIIRGESKWQKLLAQTLFQIDRLPNAFYPMKSETVWSNNCFPNDIRKVFKFNQYDLLHLHWIGNGFFPMRTLAKVDLPIVWTLHDMWGFTGGCHYSGDCTRFEAACGSCWQLGSQSARDLSARNLRAKRRSFNGKAMHVVSPSKWLAALARKSALFRQFEVSVIPNGIDLKIYRPIERGTARDIIGLPQEARIVLFGAANAIDDSRKGFSLLCSAIAELVRDGADLDNVLVVVFGSSEPREPPNLGIPIRFLGRFADDASLACLYSSADVMVVPSREENLPNTIMEAMACGIPTVAFDIGGISDLVDHLSNGYLGELYT